eukprot:6113120-Pleurochrysis_carterae.AAC.1
MAPSSHSTAALTHIVGAFIVAAPRKLSSQFGYAREDSWVKLWLSSPRLQGRQVAKSGRQPPTVESVFGQSNAQRCCCCCVTAGRLATSTARRFD